MTFKEFNTSTVTKAFCGRSATGKKKKELVLATAAHLGFCPADDNQADALAILSWCRHKRGEEPWKLKAKRA